MFSPKTRGQIEGKLADCVVTACSYTTSILLFHPGSGLILTMGLVKAVPMPIQFFASRQTHTVLYHLLIIAAHCPFLTSCGLAMKSSFPCLTLMHRQQSVEPNYSRRCTAFGPILSIPIISHSLFLCTRRIISRITVIMRMGIGKLGKGQDHSRNSNQPQNFPQIAAS